MTRVLHLIDQPGLTGETLAIRLSYDAARQNKSNEQYAWLLLGGEPMREAAHRAGLDPARVRLIPMPVGLRNVVPGAKRSLQALLGQADRVECWTVGAATIASRLGCANMLPRMGQATLCGFAKGVIDAACEDALPLSARQGGQSEAPTTATQHRAAVRQRWAVDEQSIVVAMLADQPEQVDAREALLSVAFTFETLSAAKAHRCDVRLLVHPLARRRAEAQGLAELLGQPQLVVQDAAVLSPWQVLAGCDLALAPTPSHAGLSILWADALGVPVIAPLDPMLPMLHELQHVLPAKTGVAKHLADPMTRWSRALSLNPQPF